MLYLYAQGFPCIGHIQSGNIFVKVVHEADTAVILEVKELLEELEEMVDTLDVSMVEEEEDQVEASEGGDEVDEEKAVPEEDEDLNYVVECLTPEHRSRKISCRLCGYENMLLGYRTHLYATIASYDALDRIDLIMFGHVVYEMACGRELSGLFPEAGDYEAIYDHEVRAVLGKIFDLQVVNGDYRSALAEVSVKSCG